MLRSKEIAVEALLSFLFLLFTTLALAVIQVQIYSALPTQLRFMLAYIPILGIVLNFGLSQLILHFIGLAYGLGIANMVSSAIFGFYLLYYKKKHKIEVKMGLIPRFISMKKQE